MIRTLSAVVLVLAIASPAVFASGSVIDEINATGGVSENLPGKSVFERAEELRRAPKLEAAPIKLDGRRLPSPMVDTDEFMRGRQSAMRASGIDGGQRIALAVLGSALLPGLGEAFLYYQTGSNRILWRVPFFLALEGYLWYGYSSNHDKGKDYKRQYEEYGDEHWSLEKFLTTHPCCASLIGGCPSWEEFNDFCRDQPNFFLYTSLEDDREEFYENIGKYNAFTYGWDDYVPSMGEGFTSNRNYYWGLRGDSDKYLLRADQHLMGLVVARVVSMIDSGWLAYKINKGHYGGSDWSLRMERNFSAPMVTLQYRF